MFNYHENNDRARSNRGKSPSRIPGRKCSNAHPSVATPCFPSFFRRLRGNHEYMRDLESLRFPSWILGFYKDGCSFNISWWKVYPGFPSFLRGLYEKCKYMRNFEGLRFPSDILGFCIDIISLENENPCFTMDFQRAEREFLSNEVFLVFLIEPMFLQVCPRFSQWHGY